jgi:hypothetical protein
MKRAIGMVNHLYSNFLQDEAVYASAERYWIDLWDQIDSTIRVFMGWRQPWFQPLPPSISEGNPIFSAVSPLLRRGIRILQSEPTEKGLELVAYPDTFGGSIFDPNAIHELVISCALSDVAARVALSLMLPWVQGKGVSLDLSEAGLITSDDSRVERIYSDSILLSEAGLSASNGSADERIASDYIVPAA